MVVLVTLLFIAYCKFRKFSRGFYFCETSHMQSSMKIKSSRIGEITLSFTDICKSRPCCEFLTSQICVLTLFVKIELSRKFPNLQYKDGLVQIIYWTIPFCGILM